MNIGSTYIINTNIGQSKKGFCVRISFAYIHFYVLKEKKVESMFLFFHEGKIIIPAKIVLFEKYYDAQIT